MLDVFDLLFLHMFMVDNNRNMLGSSSMDLGWILESLWEALGVRHHDQFQYAHVCWQHS